MQLVQTQWRTVGARWVRSWCDFLHYSRRLVRRQI